MTPTPADVTSAPQHLGEALLECFSLLHFVIDEPANPVSQQVRVVNGISFHLLLMYVNKSSWLALAWLASGASSLP